MRSRGGFTFVEIMACLLVISLGITAAVGMVMYGALLANRAQGRATGMATALSIAVDPAPLLPPDALWERSGDEAKGYVNGFYVVRRERADGSPAPGFTSCVVSVDVYDSIRGRPITAYTTRILRQDAP